MTVDLQSKLLQLFAINCQRDAQLTLSAICHKNQLAEVGSLNYVITTAFEAYMHASALVMTRAPQLNHILT